MMQIVARLQGIQFKFQLDRLREHEQRSLKMNSTAWFKRFGLKQIRGGLLDMNHVVSTPFWSTGFPHEDSRPKPETLFIARQSEANMRARGHE
ncbi:hypothetical protein CRG98_023455 [Punica granatum]|uniref:Uncharacterized protein n=1 Tax=Punica granatum TaxID=22663 RepID=A0A2I0JIR7_PUNGR|nr:hypothetical protein CRG98_023455 [Punica granatum]